MKYEIGRESFKQRLEDRMNFIFVSLQEEDKSPAKYKDVVYLNFGPSFKNDFSEKYPDKNQNVIVYSLLKGDNSPSEAADYLADAGYHFVYFYRGTADDVVLDKGLN